MRVLAPIVAVLLGGSALAQPAGWDECFGVTEVGVRGEVNGSIGNLPDVPDVNVPTGATGANSSADAPLSGGNLGSGEAVLIAAVVVAVALPVVVYAVDAPADRITLARHRCPSLGLKLISGGVASPVFSGRFEPLFGARLQLGHDFLGFALSVESTPDAHSFAGMDAHLLLRPPPKRHIEGALALGARRVVFGGAERNGADVALPHRYVFTRLEGRPVGLDVTPAVFIGPRGLDYRLEGGFTFPLGPMSLQFGARVFSFDTHVRGGGYAGLSFGT